MPYDPWRHYFPELLSWEHKLISEGWIFISSGRHRRVIRRNNVVIKIPYQPDGLQANRDEFFLYKSNKGQPDEMTGVVYAPCRLLKNGCLMMKALKTNLSNKIIRKLPQWAFEMVDGYQVGFDNKGKLFAFDYSCERFDRFEILY